MNFNSFEFLIFLLLVLVGYYLLKHKGQNLLLLAASYVFYASWDWRFLFLLLTTTLVDFTVSLRLVRSRDPKVRRLLLWGSLAVNLTILGLFKYFNFFVDSFIDLVRVFGYPSTCYSTLRILLPIGISFYTFKSMSYTIDVYRETSQPTRNFIHYALYVAFFPQLIAGPIERSHKLIPQFEKPRLVTLPKLEQGLFLILTGYLKKVLIADNLGIMVYECFNHYPQMSSLSLWLGVYYYAFQIYCDFSGYSDIGRGICNLLGMDQMINFRQPYFSQTVREFWTRWHISLSRWIRDYIYTPLSYKTGISKLGRNLFITMALCGLWHGATWNFVLWGIFFGLLQWVEWPWLVKRGEDFPQPPETFRQWPGTLLRMVIVFHLVCLAWILFRAPDFGSAWGYFIHILAVQPGTQVSLWGVPLILLAVFMDLAPYLTRNPLALLKMPRWALGLGYVGILILLFLFAGQSLPFIYFKF